MRLLVFADLHLDAPFAWARADVARRRRQNLRETLKHIVAVADEERADAILCAGDLYEHDRVSPDTCRFVERTLAEAGAKVLLAPGNHDWFGPRSLYARAAWSEQVHVFGESALTAYELADGLTVWGAAFHGPTRAAGFLADGFAVDRGGVHLALFHGSERAAFEFQGQAKARHAPFDATEIERAGIAHAFVGHYHRPRTDEFVTYPGNPDPLTFGETGERGVVIAEIAADGSVSCERRRVAVSEVHDLELDVTGCSNSQEVRDRATEIVADREGVARLTVSGELAPEVAFDASTLEDLGHRLDQLIVRSGDLRDAYDLAAIGDEPTVRGQFVRDVLASDLDERRRRRVLVTGLRALDGRDDLEVI